MLLPINLQTYLMYSYYCTALVNKNVPYSVLFRRTLEYHGASTGLLSGCHTLILHNIHLLTIEHQICYNIFSLWTFWYLPAVISNLLLFVLTLAKIILDFAFSFVKYSSLPKTLLKVTYVLH